MQAVTTPVKTPSQKPRLTVANSEEGVIRRPSIGRAICAPIRETPENRTAPGQIHGAPRAERSRRPTQDQEIPPPPPQAEGVRTPRRRSEAMRPQQKTPTASPARRLSEGVVMEPRAPVRTHRIELRELNTDSPRGPILDVKF